MSAIPQYEPVMLKEHAEAVYNQVLSGWVGPGKAVKEFEQAIADYTGAHYAIATSSGTAALYCVIASVNFKKEALVDGYSSFNVENSPVAIPSYGFPAAVNCVRSLGMKPILVDISKDTLCINPQKLRLLLENYWSEVVVFVNHNGYVGPDLVEVKSICDKYGSLLIEDAACALGQFYGG